MFVCVYSCIVCVMYVYVCVCTYVYVYLYYGLGVAVKGPLLGVFSLHHELGSSDFAPSTFT